MKTTTNTVKTNNVMEGNKMTINEYANEIAKCFEGSEVKQVEKTNGVILTGVLIPTEDVSVKATVYIDDYYKNSADVIDAVANIKALMEKEKGREINIDFINDFEQVRPKLRARLFNAATKSDVYRSAAPYGFQDLIITAYIEDAIPDGSIKVTSQLVKTWGLTADEVLDIAEENARKYATVESMDDVLRSMGYPVGDLPVDAPLMLIASNIKRVFGAYGIIARMDEIRAKFTEGFTVLPSSVHEVIIVDVNDPAAMTSMVQEVNSTVVDYTEQLSNHAYTFA